MPRPDWKKRTGLVRHGFTHFELEVEVYAAEIAKRPKSQGRWVPLAELPDVALPTVMRKIVAQGLDRPQRQGAGGPLFTAQTNSARKR